MRVVFDTNVIVSALLNPSGYPASVLNLVLAGQISLLYDNAILAEYGEVLSRKKFNFDNSLTAQLLNFITLEGEFVASVSHKANFSDIADKKFYDVFMTSNADFLITGNLKHFPKNKSIISPKQFIELICS